MKVGRDLSLRKDDHAWVVLGSSDDRIVDCLRYCRFARRVAPSNTYEDDRLGYDSLHDKVTKAWAKNRAIVVGIEPKTRSTPPPYPRTRVAGYLILAKNATPDLQRTFPRTDHNSLLFCEFDRGLYARSCPLCEIPLVGDYRCDNCSGGRVARMWA